MMMCFHVRVRVRAVVLGLLTVLTTGAGPLSPADEKTTFRLVDPELTIELVASEPEIASPVAVAWDANGRLFVVEMTDYPAGPKSGKVRLLVDRDGDGRYETTSTFADGLNFPNGALPWNGGVLVTAAPDILFLKDADGDGVADERRTILTGFVEGNQQLRVNGLTWGADNWVYAANGRSDGIVRRPGAPDAQAVPLNRHDFRFRPDTGEVQVVSGFSQFGLPRDDWGRRFPSWNTIPIRLAVIEQPALNRNPYLADASSVASILDPADGGRVFPISPPQTTFNRESTAYFNATCGPTILRGGLLGDAYKGNAFVCESLTNLVQRRVLEPRGTTFLGRRAEGEADREFLASTDPCFRPVNLTTGPDGALYVVDFYREMVEHPQFVPEALRTSVDFRRWNNRGRLWRIARKDAQRGASPALGDASTADLVAALDDPNGWRRDTAQRLIVERQEKAAVPLLAALASNNGATALGRAHALWTLDGLGAIDDAALGRALIHDPSAGVREAAARLADGRQGLVEALIQAADDPDVRVRFQTAIALGSLADPRSSGALAKIAARDADDEWVRLAVLSGLAEKADAFLNALLADHPEWLAAAAPGQARLLASTASIIGARNQPDETRRLVDRLASPPGGESIAGRIALLDGLSDGLSRVGGSVDAFKGIGGLLDRAAEIVASPDASPTDRAGALGLLARSRPESAALAIPSLLAAGQPEALQSASARALAVVGSPELADRILEAWGSLPIRVRREVLSALTTSGPLADRLVTAIEDEEVAVAELAPTDRDALRLTPTPALRPRIEKLLAKSAPVDRGAVVAKFQSSLDLKGDATRGAELFAKNCRTCHQRQGQGFNVGPDLSGVAGRPPTALLKDVLDPNADVAPGFATFLVVTRGGRTFSGLLAEETATSLKLRGAEAIEQPLLRSEIETIRPTGRTLMPEGFEETLGPQGLADLIAFLKQP